MLEENVWRRTMVAQVIAHDSQSHVRVAKWKVLVPSWSSSLCPTFSSLIPAAPKSLLQALFYINDKKDFTVFLCKSSSYKTLITKILIDWLIGLWMKGGFLKFSAVLTWTGNSVFPPQYQHTLQFSVRKGIYTLAGKSNFLFVVWAGKRSLLVPRTSHRFHLVW